MHQCFFLVPDYHYGLDSEAFGDIMHPPHLEFPLLPLPRYINGLASDLQSAPARVITISLRR